MATQESSDFTISRPLIPGVVTHGASDELLMTRAPVQLSPSEGWHQTKATLLNWRAYGMDDVEQEGLRAPANIVLDAAASFSEAMEKGNAVAPPNQIAPSGSGGILLERWDASGQYESIEIGPDLRVVIQGYQHSKLTVSIELRWADFLNRMKA